MATLVSGTERSQLCHDAFMKVWNNPRPVTIGVTAILIGALCLAGCSAEQSSESSPAASTSAKNLASSTVPVEFESTLSSMSNKTYKVGKKGNQVFGVNILVGSTTINGKPVDVEVLGTVNYDVGSGPFGSFLVLTWPDDSVLGMKLDGQATKNGESGATDFSAKLQVINGSGQAQDVTGSGTFTGDRSGPLATEISIKVELDLGNAPKTITGA